MLLNIDSTKGMLVIKIAKINCNTIPERTNLQFIFLLSVDNKKAIDIIKIKPIINLIN